MFKPAAKTAEMPNTMFGIILDFCATALFELLKFRRNGDNEF